MSKEKELIIIDMKLDNIIRSLYNLCPFNFLVFYRRIWGVKAGASDFTEPILSCIYL